MEEHDIRCWADGGCIYPEAGQGACEKCEYNKCQCEQCVFLREL